MVTTPATTDADLRVLVEQLMARVATLEAEVDRLHNPDEVPDEVVVAIGAAVAAFLGHRARVRGIRLAQGRRWATEERGVQHDRAVRRR